MAEYNIHTLKNGIRVIHKEINYSKITHCGFVLDIGSRDESSAQEGMAHFWEHMAFKGTKKRKAFHVINRLETVGGELNAYTTKEKIWFHASVLSHHFERATELLTDITFHSVFPEKEIQKEKNVILEEMLMYLDSPEEAIQDEFENIIFKDHQLGHNILGIPESIESFAQKDFRKFVKENMDNERICFTSIGNTPFKEVVNICEKYFSQIPASKIQKKRTGFKGYKAKNISLPKPISQAHCIMGHPSFSIRDNKRIPFFILVNLLGGMNMTSRLNMSLRERKGLVYSVEANYTPFVDTGLFSVYFGTEKKQVSKSIELILKEIKTLKEKPLGSLQLHSLKEQVKGQLAISEESNINYMQMMGKSLLDFGKIESLGNELKLIDRISAKDLWDLANESLHENKFSYLTYLPE